MATQADELLADIDESEVEQVEQDEAEDRDGAGQEGDDEIDVISLGTTEVTGAEEPEGIRNLRNRLKEIERENKALKAGAAPKVDEVGPEPQEDDFWDRPEEFKPAVIAWYERKRKADEAAGEVEKLNQSVTEDVEAGRRSFEQQRSQLRTPGFEAADDRVTEALPDIFLNALNLAAGDKAAALRFYLGTNEEALARFTALDPRKVTDLIKAAGIAGAMAKEINVQRRKPATAPEQNRSAGGASGGGSGASAKTLARLEADAAKSGDRTELIAYRRKLREQGKL